jgi:DNA-binding IclR family transcriptional regulator
MRRIREGGIAASDQEARPNLTCVAIALHDDVRQATAALAISGPSRNFDIRGNAALLRSVASEANRLAQQAAREERSIVVC